MQMLTHYEYINVGRWHSKNIMPDSNFIVLNNSFMNAKSSLIGFQVEIGDNYSNIKRIHYSVSNMELDTIQRNFPNNWKEILDQSMIMEFEQWERGIYPNMYKEGFFN